jgi:hypothetical protein
MQFARPSCTWKSKPSANTFVAASTCGRRTALLLPRGLRARGQNGVPPRLYRDVQGWPKLWAKFKA